jgi:very-short-patch-repair endonuclease
METLIGQLRDTLKAILEYEDRTNEIESNGKPPNEGIETKLKEVLDKLVDPKLVKYNYKIGKREVDVVIPSRRLAIQLDSKKWHFDYDKFVDDMARDRDIAQEGYIVIRFAGTEVHNNPEGVAREILEIAGLREKEVEEKTEDDYSRIITSSTLREWGEDKHRQPVTVHGEIVDVRQRPKVWFFDVKDGESDDDIVPCKIFTTGSVEGMDKIKRGNSVTIVGITDWYEGRMEVKARKVE